MNDTLSTEQTAVESRPRRRGWRAAAVVAALGAALSVGVAAPAQASVSSYYGGTGSACTSRASVSQSDGGMSAESMENSSFVSSSATRASEGISRTRSCDVGPFSVRSS